MKLDINFNKILNLFGFDKKELSLSEMIDLEYIQDSDGWPISEKILNKNAICIKNKKLDNDKKLFNLDKDKKYYTVKNMDVLKPKIKYIKPLKDPVIKRISDACSYSLLKHYRLSIVGSYLLKQFIYDFNDVDYIDIVVEGLTKISISGVASILAFKLNAESCEKLSDDSYRINVEPNFPTIDIFTSGETITNLDHVNINYYEFDKIMYDIHSKKTFILPTFNRFINTGYCFLKTHKWWDIDNYKLTKMIERYYDKGITFIFNENDKDIFVEHIKGKNFKVVEF